MISALSLAKPGDVQAGGQTPEFWADVALRDILAIGENAPEPLRLQVQHFRNQLRAVLVRRFRSALDAERKSLLREFR